MASPGARPLAGIFQSAIARRPTARRFAVRDACRMQRTAIDPYSSRFPLGLSSAWLARRWYYTPRSHRAYSVRQVSPGDRRLLAEFALGLTGEAGDRSLHELTSMLFDRVIATGSDNSVGFAALENTAAGDRVIGVCAYAPDNEQSAAFTIAVANAFREEQVGRTLLATMLRHAKRVGVQRLTAEMFWSNRPMQMLALSAGFAVEPVPSDRSLRRLMLTLK
jgi:RimJ/RimL family protein N-acetyltransferase